MPLILPTSIQFADRVVLTRYLLQHFALSESCLSLSSPNNFGKSTFLRHLPTFYLAQSQGQGQPPPTDQAASNLQNDKSWSERGARRSQSIPVQESSMLPLQLSSFTTPPLKIVYVDLNRRADDTAQAFYELVLRSVMEVERTASTSTTDPALFQIDLASALTTTTPDDGERLYERIVTGQSEFEIAQAFMVALETRLEALKLAKAGKLVLLLDEFDGPLTSLPGSVLRHLRALKDHYPAQLLYVTATNFPISVFDRPRHEVAAYLGDGDEEDRAEFFELFEATHARLRLRGMSQEELAHSNLLPQDGQAQEGVVLSVPISFLTTYVYEASGGHPVLARLVTEELLSLMAQPHPSDPDPAIEIEEEEDGAGEGAIRENDKPPRLLSAAYAGAVATPSTASQTHTEPPTNQVKAQWDFHLQTSSAIQLECRRLWHSLALEEQHALIQSLQGVHSGSSYLEGGVGTSGPLGSLVERGLLALAVVQNGEGGSANDGSSGPGSGSHPRIFARVFEWFVRDQLQVLQKSPPTPVVRWADSESPPKQSNMRVENSLSSAIIGVTTPGFSPVAGLTLAYDPRHEIVVFREAQTQDKLPGGAMDMDRDRRERRLALAGNMALLFKYLWLRQSIPYCTKDELITAVWGQGAAYGAENLDRLVSDLRQLLGDQDKQIIRTIHRRGLQMVNVAEWSSGNL